MGVRGAGCAARDARHSASKHVSLHEKNLGRSSGRHVGCSGRYHTQNSRSSMKFLTSGKPVGGFTTFSWVWQCVIPARARDREVSPHQYYSTARLREWFVGCIRGSSSSMNHSRNRAVE
eukprot:scaffold66598_cov66-Phaeocystis_antarctica.AAC.1